MNTTPDTWYSRPAIKELVVQARDAGEIKYRAFKSFKIAARGEDVYFAWAPAEGEAADHPLFNILNEVRDLELKLIWATRSIPVRFFDHPEFYEPEGSRRSDALWAMDRDEEMPGVGDAIKAILDAELVEGQS